MPKSVLTELLADDHSQCCINMPNFRKLGIPIHRKQRNTSGDTRQTAFTHRLFSSCSRQPSESGPAAIYLGKAPGSAASWDGSGANWFKIAEWGATFNPFQFTDFNANQLTTTIPSSVPPGEYLVRIEQIGLHVAGAPQFYISCAQINITGGGKANPAKVSIPGYVSASDPGLTVNIYYPIPTSYKVPGPAPFRG
ncbi:glycoside hydrolase family 61 protein [Moniliophthora roreri]|nr:glycoside hydrolase family 61 protein [Moniliophthora roreri]